MSGIPGTAMLFFPFPQENFRSKAATAFIGHADGLKIGEGKILAESVRFFHFCAIDGGNGYHDGQGHYRCTPLRTGERRQEELKDQKGIEHDLGAVTKTADDDQGKPV